jgi:hypothetical protein
MSELTKKFALEMMPWVSEDWAAVEKWAADDDEEQKKPATERRELEKPHVEVGHVTLLPSCEREVEGY